MNNKRFSLSLAAFVLGALSLTIPCPVHATLVTATICVGPEYPCLPGDVVDSGSRANGVGLLGANRYTALPFVFSDPFMTFNGNVFVADRAGTFIYSWGTGVGTESAAGNAFGIANGFLGNLYLDVAISQNYVTVAGPWKFAEMNVGSCNAAATGAGDSSSVVGLVNGAAMVPLPGLCSPFSLGSGPYGATIGTNTNLTAAAQLIFRPGATPAAVTLPWGSDLPVDQTDFSSANIINNFITPDNIPPGFQDAAPEPGTFTVIGGALCLAALRFRKHKP